MMSGSVQIIVPVPVVVEDQDTKPLGLLKIALENFHDIAWINIENGATCRNLILKAIKELELSINEEKLFDHVATAVRDCRTDLHLLVHKYLNPKEHYKVTIQWYKPVGEIGPGGSFGERALIKDEVRSASIYCRTLCSFATLQKFDYNWIIGAAKKRELRAMCEFMKNFRIFRELRNGSLEKI